MPTLLHINASPRGSHSSSLKLARTFIDSVRESSGGDVDVETLNLFDSGALPEFGTTAAGARIVQRTDDPGLGGSFAPAGATTGAALVTVSEDDKSYFVVWRVVDGELDVITTPPRDVVGATFDELLTYARAQYASGEGLR